MGMDPRCRDKYMSSGMVKGGKTVLIGAQEVQLWHMEEALAH